MTEWLSTSIAAHRTVKRNEVGAGQAWIQILLEAV